jgi:hypothetical protein
MVFRYAIATGRAERDPSVDLRGALITPTVKHRATILEPTAIGALLRAIERFDGQPTTRAALRLAPLVFVRPGELRHAEWKEVDFDKAEWVTASICRRSSFAIIWGHIARIRYGRTSTLRNITSKAHRFRRLPRKMLPLMRKRLGRIRRHCLRMRRQLCFSSPTIQFALPGLPGGHRRAFRGASAFSRAGQVRPWFDSESPNPKKTVGQRQK